ncbi:MAG: hypothetical protein RMA76_18285 [Deltaproteobacteria bacterium]|jgi:hypothetical protein
MRGLRVAPFVFVAACAAAPAKAPAPETVSIAEECRDGPVVEQPDPPPPDISRPQVIALGFFRGNKLSADGKAAVLAAVRERVARDVELRLISAAEVAGAEQLHAEHRWKPGGPACAQARPVVSLLADRHPNLVTGTISSMCRYREEDGELIQEACSLMVHFDRVGSDDRTDLPAALAAKIEGNADDYATWVEAARVLEPGLALSGLMTRSYALRVSGYEAYDAQLRIRSTLRDLREPLGKCRLGADVASLDLRWTIAPDGHAGAIEVGPRIAPDDVTARRIAQCVAKVMAESAWPCTPSGKPERVSARLCMVTPDDE